METVGEYAHPTWLGEGYKQAGPGRYVSADGTRQVRFTDSDLAKSGNHAGAPHMNFEEVRTIVKPNGKESFVPKGNGNSHIYLPEEQ